MEEKWCHFFFFLHEGETGRRRKNELTPFIALVAACLTLRVAIKSESVKLHEFDQ
jgi:hypothetical protein